MDYVASYFQHEFILTIDRIKASNETLEENTTGSNLINEILMAHQANADKIIDTPITEEESIAEVHKFVGYAVSKAKSEYHELESELIDDKVHVGALLEEMTCMKEELKEDEVKKYYPRIIHLKSMKQREAVSNGLEKVLISPSFFDFGLTLMKKIRGLVSQDTIKKEGPLVVIKAHEKLFKDEEIWGEFCKAVPSQMEEEFEERDIDLNDIFEFILEKSLKSRTGVEIDRFKEANTRRNAEKARDLTLRAFLKATKRNVDKKEPAKKKQKTKKD